MKCRASLKTLNNTMYRKQCEQLKMKHRQIVRLRTFPLAGKLFMQAAHCTVV